MGRGRIAEILRTAQVAESDATREAEQAEAAARARAEVATKNAQGAVQRKQNELRQIKAEVDADAQTEEVRAVAAGQQARAESELALQKIRGELEQLRLEAEVTIPAEIDAQVKELIAAGQAAPIAADGDAMARSLAEVSGAWRDSGGRAMDMFVLQHLDQIFGDVASAAQPHQGRRGQPDRRRRRQDAAGLRRVVPRDDGCAARAGHGDARRRHREGHRRRPPRHEELVTCKTYSPSAVEPSSSR